MVLKIFNSVIYTLLIVLLPIVVNSTQINNVEENDSTVEIIATQTTTSTTTTANRQSTKYETEEIPDEEGLDNRTIVVIIMVSVAFAFVLLGVFMVIRSSMKKDAQKRNDAVADKEAPQPRRQSFDSINKEPDGKYININENGHVNDDASKAPAPRMFAKNPQRNFSLTNAAAANAESNAASQPRAFGQDMRNFSLTATKNNGSAQQQQDNNRHVSPNERFHYDRSIEEEDEEEYDDQEDENKFYLDDQDDDNNNGHYEQANKIPEQKEDVEMTQF